MTLKDGVEDATLPVLEFSLKLETSTTAYDVQNPYLVCQPIVVKVRL